MYYDPEVIIMDEATSALDNITEKAVMSAVDNLSEHKTVVMIAHRLSTIRNCDLIYLMNDGKVSAKGTFEELIVSSPEFQKMNGTTSNAGDYVD